MLITFAATRANDPEVHLAGCADVARGLRSGKYQDTQDAEVSTRYEAIREWWEDIIEERQRENRWCIKNDEPLSFPDPLSDLTVRFMPCASRLLPE